MVKQINFTSTDASQVAGNNNGFIYSPHTVHHTGLPFDIKAGEALIIVPFQPAGNGPWKVCQSVLVNSSFKTFIKRPKVLCIQIQNKWISKSIHVRRFCTLQALLSNQGIGHNYSTITFDDLKDSQTDENDEIDNEEEDNDIVEIKKESTCPCCLKVR